MVSPRLKEEWGSSHETGNRPLSLATAAGNLTAGSGYGAPFCLLC
jgi:hypothetical protein